MILFHTSTTLSLSLLLVHLLCFILIKLFTTCILGEGDSKRDLLTADEFSSEEDLIADVILGGEGLLFLYNQSTNDTLLSEHAKETNCFEIEDTQLVSESANNSLLEKEPSVEKHGIEHREGPAIDVRTPSDCPSPIVSTICNDPPFEENSIKVETYEKKEKKSLFSEEKFLLIENSLSESKRFHLEDVHHDNENLAGSLTGESTSKSSIEWRSSTIFRDSEAEYPFSSSSRRSTSHWESYAVFRKYDEEMIFFDRVSAQKLTETESLRSLKNHPRSISQRIVHKLTTKKPLHRVRIDPYLELESAYVSQVCLTWEALNWNYKNFQRVNKDRGGDEDSGYPSQIAQQFQQFQVLLQRFIENEPFERGRRPEVFARVRITSPKLLQVPEFHASEEDENKEGTSWMISSAEFLAILEDAIRTFLKFLKADKESRCQKFRSLIKKRKPSSVDPTFLHLLKKINKKKKLRLKELGRRKNCLVKWKLDDQKEMEILMGLIDMKIVSRVLRMPDISEEQLHWCEEKMSKVRVMNGKIQRDYSGIFFPAHS